MSNAANATPKKKGNTTEHEVEIILDAINGTGYWEPREQGKITSSFGNIMAIAARLDVHRVTVYRYAKKWKSVENAIKEARELRKDLVEDKMLRRIMDGSDVMMIFFAKTQMKDRGYIERQEITGAEGAPVTVKVIKGVSVDDL